MISPDTIEAMATLAVHGVAEKGGEHAHLAPIYATSTFTFDNARQGMDRFAGREPGFIYSRFANPTTAAAADLIARLEAHGIFQSDGRPLEASGLLTASGQAALSTLVMSLVQSGDTIITNQALYGGTYEFFSTLLAGLGIHTCFINMSDTDAVRQTLKAHPNTRLIHLETPANPVMQCTDLAAICSIAREHGVLVSVDNTFATPYLQQPFRYGADYIFHSTTKFLNGHGTAIGGVVLGRDTAFMTGRMTKIYKLLGGNANPFDAFLLMQGIKTLALRMDRHCSNALQVARYLNDHPSVNQVNYNGLESHPDYPLTQRQMRHAGAVLSFELKANLEQAIRFIDRLKICVRAVSLGTTDTLISHPASMSHSGMTPEERQAAGISEGLFRMSVGLEDPNDLLRDLDQALAGA
ncbi:methionine gamma-lyase [Niabella terrae]